MEFTADPQSTTDVARAEPLLAVVRELVAEVHAQGPMPPAVSLASSLDRDLGLDSLARVELLVRVERRFSVRLPETVLGKVQTVRDLLRELEAVGPAAPPAPAPAPAPPPLSAAEPAPAATATLIEALHWHAQRHPERVHVVLTDGETEIERLTYAALADKAAAMAVALAARGLQPGDRVALMLPTGTDFLTAFFGALLAGGIPVPLYPPPGAARIGDHLARERGILVNSEARFLITWPEVQPYARLAQAGIPTLSEILVPQALRGGGPASAGGRRADIALLQYTSGSTGHPKGVVLTHENLLANIRTMGRAVRIAPTDVFVSWLPLYHDMGLIGAWLGSLYFGTPLVLMSPLHFLQRPERWLRSIQRYRGTLSGGPNFAYELCLKRIENHDLAGLDLNSWRFAFNGAEPVSATTLQRFAARFALHGFDPRALAPVYGLAECSVGLAFSPPGRGPVIDAIDRRAFLNTGRAVPAAPGDAAALHMVGCGHALPEHRIRIVDAPGLPLAERREGRIQFAGPSATSGYYRNAAATAALFCDSWLDTGDLGYIAEGELYPTGRVKDVIIRAGRHFHPDELEEAVGRLPGVRQGCVAVFGSMDPATGTEHLVVVAETREADAARIVKMRSAINALAVDLLGTPVDHVLIVPPHTVLKTSSGKVRRAETRLLYERGMLTAGFRMRVLQSARLAWDAIKARSQRFADHLAALAYAGYGWTLFALCVVPAAALLTLPSSYARRQAVARRWARIFLRAVGLLPQVTGLAELPREQKCIFVVNHASYIDGLVLLAALPGEFRFAAKHDVAASRALTLVLHAVGVLLVESFDPARGAEAATALVEAVRQGPSLAVFPEGTFAREPGVLPFHLGAFVAAAQSHTPVVPIALTGTRRVLPDGSWLARRAPLSVTVCPPLRPAGENFEAALALRDAARSAIARACGEGEAA